jgi:hypothetical protein
MSTTTVTFVRLTLLPAVVAAGEIATTLALRRVARRAKARTERQGDGSKWSQHHSALTATSNDIDTALRQTRAT